MVEVNCETDFVARSEAFRTFAHEAGPANCRRRAAATCAPKIFPPTVLEHEREIGRAPAREEGKPEAMLDRIVEGRLEKFKDEVCLLRQAYIRDESITIEKLLIQNVAAIGENIVIRRFARWELGESTEE